MVGVAEERGWGLQLHSRRRSRLTWADDKVLRAKINAEMKEMGEAKWLKHHNGYTIDDNDDDMCMKFSMAGTKWISTTSNGENAINILGRAMMRNTDEQNTATRIRAAKNAYNNMR